MQNIVNKISNYKFEITIFVIEIICMMLELIASRIISPYFGNSNIVWTSVIGIILLGGSVGNYIGGIMADKKYNDKNLKDMFFFLGIIIFCIPLIKDIVLKNLISIVSNKYIGAVVAVMILFFIPYFIFGLFTPIIIKQKINENAGQGKETGKIIALSTVGGIVGTFLGGFFFIPKFGCIEILFILSIFLFILAMLYNIKSKLNILIVIMIIFSLVTSIFYTKINNHSSNLVLEGKENVYADYDTQYGKVLIYNTNYNGKKIRMLNIDSGYESATFLEDEKKYELVFSYTKYYDLMFKSKNDIKNTLLIGGAGYSYPKYYISRYLDKRMDVVEIDSGITEIAKKYFFLNDLFSDYDLDENNRLTLINDDGRVYLNNTNKKYDTILNDAFSGNTPAKTLTTYENIVNVKKSLNNNGLYLTNIISSLEGENSKFLRAEVNTLKKIFKNVYVIPCSDNKNEAIIQNNMVIATDDNINYENTYDLKINENEIILTDEYNPVDTLIPR